MREIQITDADSKHMQPPGEPWPGSARVCHLLGTVSVTESSRDVPLSCQASCFKMVENVVRVANSMSMAPLPHFIAMNCISLSEAWCVENCDGE